MRYVIEQLGKDNRWSIVGSEADLYPAKAIMQEYQARFPNAKFRIIDTSTRTPLRMAIG